MKYKIDDVEQPRDKRGRYWRKSEDEPLNNIICIRLADRERRELDRICTDWRSTRTNIISMMVRVLIDANDETGTDDLGRAGCASVVRNTQRGAVGAAHDSDFIGGGC